VHQPLEGISVRRNLSKDGRDLAEHGSVSQKAQLKTADETQKQAAWSLP
jgi:hypothetical protein